MKTIMKRPVPSRPDLVTTSPPVPLRPDLESTSPPVPQRTDLVTLSISGKLEVHPRASRPKLLTSQPTNDIDEQIKDFNASGPDLSQPVSILHQHSELMKQHSHWRCAVCLLIISIIFLVSVVVGLTTYMSTIKGECKC